MITLTDVLYFIKTASKEDKRLIADAVHEAPEVSRLIVEIGQKPRYKVGDVIRFYAVDEVFEYGPITRIDGDDDDWYYYYIDEDDGQETYVSESQLLYEQM